MRNNYIMRNAILYLILLLAIGCGTKKNTVEKVVVKDSISYALPARAEISLAQVCDTLEVPVLKTKVGPVRTEIVYRDGKPVLVTEYDTIFKEEVRYVDRVKEIEVVKNRLGFGLAIKIFIVGAIAGALIYWRVAWR